MIDQHVEEIVRQLFSTEEQFSDCFLLEVIWKKPKKIQVFFDADGGVDFDKCQKLSRKIEAELDASGTAGEDYTLEVSSGGVDRPLQFLRQYPKHIGRNLAVTVGDEQLAGELIAVEEDGIILAVKEKDAADPKKEKNNYQPSNSAFRFYPKSIGSNSI